MRTREVAFYAREEKIVGTIYLPDDYQEGEKLPCIIPCSGYTGINAAYPALLARLFTKHGYGCLGFDYRGWAPSEGEVGVTIAEEEYFDIEAAYIFACQQPEFDANNIALFGWGFAAATVIKVAAQYPEIKCVGCGNGFYNGERLIKTILGWKDYLAFRKIMREDLTRRVLTGEKGALTSPYFQGGHGIAFSYNIANRPKVTLDWLTSSDSLEFYHEDDTKTKHATFMDLEGTRKAIEENWAGQEFPPKQSFISTESFLRVDAVPDAKKMSPRPIFVVHAKGDDTYPVSEAEAFVTEIGPRCTACFVEGDHNNFMFDDDPEFETFSKSILAFYDQILKA